MAARRVHGGADQLVGVIGGNERAKNSQNDKYQLHREPGHQLLVTEGEVQELPPPVASEQGRPQAARGAGDGRRTRPQHRRCPVPCLSDALLRGSADSYLLGDLLLRTDAHAWAPCMLRRVRGSTITYTMSITKLAMSTPMMMNRNIPCSRK